MNNDMMMDLLKQFNTKTGVIFVTNPKIRTTKGKSLIIFIDLDSHCTTQYGLSSDSWKNITKSF